MHVDCNNFYCSCELRSRPDLAGAAVAVCGDPKKRHGVILAKNELAKKAGVKTGESVFAALQKCPSLQFLPPHHSLYHRVSEQVNAIFLRYTDLVEPFGIDESWLDVTASEKLFGDGMQIAERIHEDIRREHRLTVSIGVSFNKVFAKLGSDYKKPDATTLITPENFREKLYPLPVSDMLFVGKSAAAALVGAGIETIGDLAASDDRLLTSLLHKRGPELKAYALGLDSAPVLPYTAEKEAKSIGNGFTFARNVITEADRRTALITLCDKVAARLRRAGLSAGSVQVTVKSAEFKLTQRQRVLESPTNQSAGLYRAALVLLNENFKRQVPIRALTVTALGLERAGRQVSFFDEAQSPLETALDEIRGKYGGRYLMRASQLHNDLGIVVENKE